MHFLTEVEKRVLRGKFARFVAGGDGMGMGMDRASFAYFCCQNYMLDFSRLFYRGLSVFKLK